MFIAPAGPPPATDPDIVRVVLEEEDGFSRVAEINTAFGEVIFQEIEDEEGRRAAFACNTVWTPEQALRVGEALVAMARRAGA